MKKALKRRSISRFTDLAEQEAEGPYEVSAWNGIRELTDEQINRLAEEMARQVKLRGPFLNMSEFINRRFDNSNGTVEGTSIAKRTLSMASAIQSAIDWDEFNMGFDGTVDTDD